MPLRLSVLQRCGAGLGSRTLRCRELAGLSRGSEGRLVRRVAGAQAQGQRASSAVASSAMAGGPPAVRMIGEEDALGRFPIATLELLNVLPSCARFLGLQREERRLGAGDGRTATAQGFLRKSASLCKYLVSQA